MSLVAYASSSDEESDNELSHEPINILDGNISDEDEYSTVSRTHNNNSIISVPKKIILKLPSPNKTNMESEFELSDTSDNIKTSLLRLPLPKTNCASSIQTTDIKEEDDEFLHKKEVPPTIEKPSTKVKITIPSLSKFKHLEESSHKSNKFKPSNNLKCIGLLNMLPKPKNEQFFTTSKIPTTSADGQFKIVKSLIPDSVKNVHNKQQQPGSSKNLIKQKNNLVNVSDSEDDDNETGDFFSLNTEEKLPEVSLSEINAMVEKRAAKMAEASIKIENMLLNKTEDKQVQLEAHCNDKYYKEEIVHFDQNAIQALVGSQAKRKKLTENVEVVELTSAQVLPNKDEWLRSALASETSYQPKGVLLDEEPAPGTRKKHQITYLAHQAKANEAELQAMWAANRNTRRATASKYGF